MKIRFASCVLTLGIAGALMLTMLTGCGVRFGFASDPDDPNEEPVLEYIEDDDVYEKVADAFDEYLDSCEFDEIIDDNDSEE